MDMCILLNGKIIMVDDQFSIQQAVAIEGDRIKAVGQNATVRALAGPTTEVIDLHGRTVIPGLIDNHNHFIRGADQPVRHLVVGRDWEVPGRGFCP